MKSLKLAMIAGIVAITMVGAANAGIAPSSNKITGKVINITLQQAMSDLGLVAAIVRQVSLDEVLKSHSDIFVARVLYKNYTFEITGSRNQWILFFRTINAVEFNVSSDTANGK